MMTLSAEKTSPVTTASKILPQLVTSRACLECEICCRFPDSDSMLRPYFTGEEIARAVAHGLEATAFPDSQGSQVTLIPDAIGEGFHCPAFEPAGGTCRLYEQRPLDCQLYPLALMWNASHDQVVLGWDAKCPFVGAEPPASIRRHADRVLRLLEEPATIEQIARHPRLVGRFQEDVSVLASLAPLTERIHARWAQPLTRLDWDDLPRLLEALERSGLAGTAAAYTAPYHYLWNALLPYWWTELEGAFCLFVHSPSGWFMPLPPLTAGSTERPLAEAFSLMSRWNGGAIQVSRIENVPEAWATMLGAKGYRLASKDPDYVYRADALARLAGDRYKSHRALCNRVEREAEILVEPYHVSDRTACRLLFQQWTAQKRARGSDRYAECLLDDSRSAHEVAWSHAAELNLAGWVVRRDGRLCGYTFGYWLNQKTWCVLLEVADRRIPGLAQYLFRETCRKALSQGAEFINTLDDSGLAGLRQSKEGYHPIALSRSFICSEVGEP
jgi:uncharacterized protein